MAANEQLKATFLPIIQRQTKLMADNNLKLTVREIPIDTSEYFMSNIGPHFRLVEQEGVVDEGVSIKPGMPEDGKSLEVRFGDKGVFRLDLVNNFSVPNRFFDKSGYGLRVPTIMSVSHGNPCSSDIFLFSPKRDLPHNSKLLETKIGDFDNNGLVDFAYVVQKEDLTVASLVYYQESLAQCFYQKKNTEGEDLEKTKPYWGTTFENDIFEMLKKRKRMTPKIQAALAAYHNLKRIFDVPFNEVSFSVFNDYVMRGLETLNDEEVLQRLNASIELLDKVKATPKLLLESYTYEVKDRTQYYQLLANLFSPNRSDAQNILAFRLATRIVEDFATQKEDLRGDQIRVITQNINAVVNSLPERRTIVLNYLLMLKKTEGRWNDLEGVFSFFLDALFSRHLHNYRTFYGLIGGAEDISPQQFQKYSPLLDNDYPPQIRDIIACEETIGAENALLLAEKLNITRFGRYDESLLWHNVKLLTDHEYERDKPLVLSVVAKRDETDMFYWGRHFERDERVRIVNIEVGTVEELLKYTKQVVKDYGQPDSILISAHGEPGAILLGDRATKDTTREFIQTRINFSALDELKAFFRETLDNHPQIVINSCNTATDTLFDVSLAQSLSNYTGSEVRAARGVEAMLDLKLEFENGKARLSPHFFQLGGLDTFGYVIGGTRFLPQEISLPTEVSAASVPSL